jgi:ABC-2 type transport system permease protein
MTTMTNETSETVDPIATSETGDADDTTKPIERDGRDWQAIRTVMLKDLTAVRRSKAIVIPMIAVPTLLLVVLPVALGLFARNAPTEQVANALESPIVHDLVTPILSLPERERIVVLVLGYLLSPLLLVIPLMVSAVLAADAFAGEKERRTLEGLLHLPISDRDLFLAKVLGAYVPAVVITFASAILYAVICNIVAWPVTGHIFLPFTQWALTMIWVAPAVALLALGLLVIVSSKAKTTQEANQLGGAVILPLIFVVAAQASGLMLAPPLAVLIVGALVWIGALALVVINGRRFTRDRLAASS